MPAWTLVVLPPSGAFERPQLFGESDPVPHMSVFLLLKLVGLHFEASAGRSFLQQRCRWSSGAEALPDVEQRVRQDRAT